MLVLGVSCKNSKVDVPSLPTSDGGTPTLPSLKLPLPTTSDGKFVLFEAAGSRLKLDPTVRDPLTALGACTDLITHCYQPGSESLDGCVASAKACGSSKPWELLDACCPTSCRDAYAAARAGGQDEFTAFDQTFFLAPDCFPGVRAALEGN